MIALRKAAYAAVWMLVCLSTIAAPAAAQVLTPPWTSVEIGAPALPGAVTAGAGAVVVDAAGQGILDATDQFLFVYQPVTGDVDLRVRIEDVAAVNQWSTAGLMIRADLTATAAHGSLLWLPDGSHAFQRRTAANGTAVRTAGTTGQPWLRIVRAGSIVTTYVSPDGATWKPVASDTIALGTTAYVGLAVASNDPAVRTTAWTTNLSVSSPGAAALLSTDIGTPAFPGRVTLSNGRYTVVAEGSGLMDFDDSVHFVYREVTGDVTITARVNSIVNGHKFATGGVSIRETLDPSSAHASVAGTRAAGWTYRSRTMTDALSNQSVVASGLTPGWVRVVRKGSLFESFLSKDGVTWTRVASETVTMGATANVGLVVASRQASKASTAVFDQVQIVQPPPPANALPLVSLTTATAAQALSAPASVTLAATASDVDGTITAVEFYAGCTYLGQATAAPYVLTVPALAVGTHEFRAVAVDDRSGSALSAPLSVVVQPPNVAPSVTLTAPAPTVSLVAPASLSIAANASDNDGTVVAVEFYLGSTLLTRDVAAPYAYTVTGLAAGTYTVLAVAVDDDGATTSSNSVTVTVAPAPVSTSPADVVFTASTNHATAVTNYRLAVHAAGKVPGVDAPVSTLDLGKPAPAANGDIAVSCSAFFTALPKGSYVLTVLAMGPSGTARSAAVAFTR